MSRVRDPVVAALLTAFEEGALLCDLSGTIRQHNRRAVHLLASPRAEPPATLIGQSAYAWLDEHLLRHALAEVARPRTHPDDQVEPALFAVAAPDGALFRVKVFPVEAQEGPLRQVILTMAPLAHWEQTESLEGQFLQEVIEGQRGPLASIRAAIETMVSYPGMDEAVAAQFQGIILEQTEVLSTHLSTSLEAYAESFKAAWPLETMSGATFLGTVQRHLAERLEVPVDVEPPAKPIRLRIDSFALTHAVGFIAQLTRNATHCEAFLCRLRPVEAFVALDLVWEGTPLRLARLKNWETQPIELEDTVVSTTLREILTRHRAEMWSSADDAHAYVRLLLVPS
ncbi:MAG: hypothetical protein AAGI71_08265 [Bacteroidota bacterium]